MKNTRKIIPALCMLLVAAVMLASASYAWFTMSKEVAAQGMKVNIVAPQNLVISNTASGTYATTATADEATTSTLKPASTITGANDTFYAINDNQILTDGYKSTENSTFSKVDGTTLQTSDYYTDFTFWISTQYAATTDLDVKVLATSTSGLGSTGFTKDSLAEGQDLGSMRFAVIKNDDSTSAGVYTGGDAYVTSDQAVSALTAENKATMGAVTQLTASDTVVATVPEGAVGASNAQKVTIRVWCEGESNKCAANKIANVSGVTLTVIFGY